jgi:hypothetical protein
MAIPEEDEGPTEETPDRPPPTVSLLSKEQAMKLLNPGRGQAARAKGVGKVAREPVCRPGRFASAGANKGRIRRE